MYNLKNRFIEGVKSLAKAPERVKNFINTETEKEHRKQFFSEIEKLSLEQKIKLFQLANYRIKDLYTL